MPSILAPFDPPVSGDDLVFIADQDRVGEAEALDAPGDLRDLLLRVGAGVARIGAQARNRHLLDSDVSHWSFSQENAKCRGAGRLA
jgi:hypothetical protein